MSSIGGITSVEKEAICSGATHIVILAGDPSRIPEWREFAKKVGLTVIAEIHSDYHGTEDTALTHQAPVVRHSGAYSLQTFGSEGGAGILFPPTQFLPAPPDLSARVSTAAERFGILRNAAGVSLKMGLRIFKDRAQLLNPTRKSIIPDV